MFVGQESRIRDRFCHRRELDENARDFYYNPQNVMRLNRNSKDGAKIWPRKHEERDHPHAIEHQKHRSSRTPIDDYGYPRYNPYHKYPEHHRYRTRSRSPIPLWPPQHRREFSDERRYERRKEGEESVKSHPTLRHEPRRPSEHGSTFSSAKHSNYLKMKNHLVSKARSTLRLKWGSETGGGSRNTFVRSRPHSVHIKHSTPKTREPLRTPSKKKSLSRVSSSDFKSSPSTEHLEKQKKYLVDRLAEYEHSRKASPHPVPVEKPKSPKDEEKAEKEDAENKKESSIHSSPSSSSLQSFDEGEEINHFNINFPDNSDDEDDEAVDKELQKHFEPLENPELVKMNPPVEFRPFFLREEFKRKKEDGLKDEDKLLIKEFRKNGLKKDSAENRKFLISQTVVENTPDTSQIHEPSDLEASERRRRDVPTTNLTRKFQPRQLQSQKKSIGDGFDLRQRIHERLQNKQSKHFHNQSGDDDGKQFLTNKDYYRRANQDSFDGEFVDHKAPVRRVVSNSRSIGLVRTFSNGSSQPKRSVVLTRPRPTATNRFLQ